MARKCPPGVICVENALFGAMFGILVLLLAFVVYRSTQNKSQMSNSAVYGGDSSMSSSSSIGIFSQPNPSYSFSNLENDVLMNPYAPPQRDDSIGGAFKGGDIRGGIPINIRTQTADTSFRQIGILTRQNGSEMILPLMGKPLITNRDKWQFYAMNDKNIKLPVVHKGKSGTSEYGCDNVYNGDSVYVEGIKDAFKVTVYDNATARYIPFV